MNIPIRYFLPVLLSITAVISGCQTKIERLQEAIAAGQTYLMDQQREDGAICEPKNPRFEMWETVMALHVLRGGGNPEALAKGEKYLKDHPNTNGLICHNAGCKDKYCLETSAAYALYLNAHSEYDLAKSICDTIYKLRQPDGHWEIGNPEVTEKPGLPSVTGFCTWALLVNGYPADSLIKSIRWIFAQQTVKGDFGSGWEYYGTHAYALWPIANALEQLRRKLVQYPTVSDSIFVCRDNIKLFLKSGRQDDGSITVLQPGLTKSPSPVLETALAALAMMPDRHGDQEMLDAAIDYLLNQQKEDGSWDGGFFPVPNARYEKREDVFTTAMVIRALNTYGMEYMQ